MSEYTHTLTDLETACGVTLEDVARELPRGVFADSGRLFVIASNVGPALAGSVARCAFAGPAEFAGMNALGQPVYRAMPHNAYPHNPGYLYDCAACESACHCTEGSAECVFDGEHNGEASA